MTNYPVNSKVYGVNVIPASGEFVYDTVAYSGKAPGTTSFVPINTYFAPGGTKTDFLYSLDQLQQILPNCGFVAIVVQWMGNSLDLSQCKIYPSTTYYLGTQVGAFQPTAGAGTSDSGLATSYWRVSGLTMANCNAGLIPISRNGAGSSAYGGTPSDQSIVRAIQAVKARGLKVCLYLQMNMDVAGQPWRGQVTYDPSVGSPGSDISAAATAAVNAFFGSAATGQFTRDATNLTVNYSGAATDFTYRRFILHYANLAIVAGGVNLLTIGSEMRGIEGVRGPAWTPAGTVDGGGHAVWDYPAVAQLVTLINDCRSVFDAAGYTKNLAARSNLITYSADWSQWMGVQHAGITGIFPLMDPVYACANTDLVSFDNYLPVSDWASGDGGLDAANWQKPVITSWPNPTPLQMGIGLSSPPDVHDVNYLMFGLEHGEKADFFYGNYASTTALDPKGSGQYVTAPQGDRLAQARNAYSTGQELFALKKFRWWWNNTHRAVYDALDGFGAIPRGPTTAWTPQSKSIMWQEYGFASIDRDPNEENLFYSPGSLAGGTPFWCSWRAVDGGSLAPVRDDLIMFNAHQAWGTYWGPGNANNQTSSGGVQMIATDMMFAWNWDARPFPVFPLRLDVWADGSNWPAGMWMAGKGPQVAIPAPPTPPGAGSYLTFPTLLGAGWTVHYKPRFQTSASTHVTGRETRQGRYASPLWDIELTLDFLRQGWPWGELEALIGFLGQNAGQNLPFLFAPPGNLGVFAGATLGTGDGSTTAFRVARTLNGYVENVQALIGSPTVYANGVVVPSANYSVSILPTTIVFTSAPGAGVALTVDFSAAHVARFSDDDIDLEEFMSAFWTTKTLRIETVRS